MELLEISSQELEKGETVVSGSRIADYLKMQNSSETAPSIRCFVLLLMGTLLLAAFLRFWSVDNHGVWIDETWVVTTPNFHYDSDDIFPKFFDYPQVKSLSMRYQALAREIYSLHPVIQICFMLVSDMHPPLYYVAAYYWNRVFGQRLYSIRGLNILFGLLSIVFLSLLVRQMFGDGMALLSALYLALSPAHVHLSQMARNYSLMCLLVILSFYFFHKLIKSFTWNYILGYGVCIYLSILTHYYCIFFVLSQFLSVMILEWGNERRFIRWLSLYAVVAFFYIPWLPALYVQMVSRDPTIKSQLMPFSFNILLDQLYFLGPFPSLTRRFVSGSVLRVLEVTNAFILITLIIFGLRKAHNNQKASLFLVCIWAFGPIFLLSLVSIFKPFYAEGKCLFPVLPAFSVLILFGAVQISRIRAHVLISTLFCCMLLSQIVWPTYPGMDPTEDTRGLITHLAGMMRSADTVAVQPGLYRDGLWYYHKRDYTLLTQTASIEVLPDRGRIWLLRYWDKNQPTPFLHGRSADGTYSFFGVTAYLWVFS